MFLDLVEQAVQHGGEDRDHERGCDCAEDGPDDERVPLPRPQGAGGCDGMMACAVEEFMAAERHSSGVEDAVADLDEDEEERKLQGVDNVVGDLRGDQVEAKGEGKEKTGDGGGAE